MKNALKLSGLTVLLGTAAYAGELQVGNGAVQLDASLTGVYDSNLRASVEDISDFYLSFAPTLRYRRLGARFTTEASVGMRFKRYDEYTRSNSDDASGSLNWHMDRTDGHTTAADLSLGYFESTDAVVEVNDQVRSKVFYANTSGEVLVAGRNLFNAGFTYRDSQRNIGSNQIGGSGKLGYSYVGFPDGSKLNFTYIHQENQSTDNLTGQDSLDQKADTTSVTYSRPIFGGLTGGVTYGYRWLDRGAYESLLGLNNTSGSFYGLLLEGQFLPKQYFPKTTGTFRLAYEQADVPGLNDRSNERLVGQVNVAWAARERTTFRVFASRTQDLTINDNTVVNESGGIGVTQKIGQFIDSDLSLRYTNADFLDLERTDDRYEARIGATYKINRLWSSALSYSYTESKSNVAIAHFERHVVSGTLTHAF